MLYLLIDDCIQNMRLILVSQLLRVSHGVLLVLRAYFFIIGLLISGGLGGLLILASGRISLEVGFIAEIFAVLTVVGILVLSAVYGQSGSRVFRKLDSQRE